MDRIFQNLTPEERKLSLANLAEEVIDSFHYSVPLTDEEYAELESEYSELGVELHDVLAAKKDMLAEFKKGIDALSKRMDSLVQPLKSKVDTPISLKRQE